MGPEIPVELQLLMAAVVIGFVQIICATVAGGGGERDFKWLAGPRDEPKPMGVVAARLKRAQANFFETFPLFAAAILACVLVGKIHNAHTLYGGLAYVVGRALYVPLYAAGIPLLRTVAWIVSVLGIVAIMIAFFH